MSKCNESQNKPTFSGRQNENEKKKQGKKERKYNNEPTTKHTQNWNEKMVVDTMNAEQQKDISFHSKLS